MSQIHFFTPLDFSNEPKSLFQSLVEFSDNYFYLGGKKAFVLPNHLHAALVINGDTSFLSTTCKIISYFTIILPILLLMTKTILRAFYSIHSIQSSYLERLFKKINHIKLLEEPEKIESIKELNSLDQKALTSTNKTQSETSLNACSHFDSIDKEKLFSTFRLLKFYDQKGILVNPSQLIEIPDLSTLKLGRNLDSSNYILLRKPIKLFGLPIYTDVQIKRVSLKEIAMHIIDQLNESFSKPDSDSTSIQSNRTVIINANKELLKKTKTEQKLWHYRNTGLPYKKDPSTFTTDEKENGWIPVILKALVEQGHIFAVSQSFKELQKNEDPTYTYIVQA